MSGGLKKLIFDAVKRDNIELIRFLVSRGMSVNLKNSFGETLLHVAVLNKRTKIVKHLIEIEADVNGTNKDGSTALHEASKFGNMELVELLLHKGADVNAKNKYFYTPLHCAAECIYCQPESVDIFEALLAAGADVNAKNNLGDTPLHFISRFDVGDAPSIMNKLQALAKYDADFNAKNNFGWTPVYYAIEPSNFETVKALFSLGRLDVNSQFTTYYYYDIITESILHTACNNCDTKTVKFLLKNGANINALSNHNVSPLAEIIDRINVNGPKSNNLDSNVKFLNYFLNWNPDVNTITEDGSDILTPRNGDEFPDSLWQTIIRHLAKLCATERPIHPSLIKTISSKAEYSNFFSKCQDELEQAKIFKIHPNRWLTLFDFLIDDKKKLVHYAGNEQLVLYLTKSNIVELLPIYGIIIYKRFLKVVEIRKKWNEAAVTISHMFPRAVDSDHPAVMTLLSFLDMKDLRKLCM